MPKQKRTPDATPSKELVLAAIERAERHQAREKANPGIPLSTVKEHLGLAHHGWTTIRLRPHLEALESAGLIEQFRRRGFDVITLTGTGQARLDAARHAGKVGQLPESPQHQHWREARMIADNRIGEFCEGLRRVLGDATGLLDAHERTDSDTWHELGERLQLACMAIESASYCLHEWPEPDDARADIAPRGKDGCRGIRRFDKD